MNLLAPFASFCWRKRIKFQWQSLGTMCLSLTSCSGELYIVMPSYFENALYRISADLSSWKALRVPSRAFALTTYHNQLVMLGGLVHEGYWRIEVITDTVWVSDDGEHWNSSSLPPLTSGRLAATAINTGNPEFLVVIGGLEGRNCRLEGRRDIVEVLVDSKDHPPQWESLQSLPRTHVGPPRQPVLHNGNLLFSDCYCKLEELKAECEVAFRCRPQLRHLRSGKVLRPLNSDLWKRSTPLALASDVLMISYKQQLLGFTRSGDVMVFCPFDEDSQWIHIDTMPGQPLCACVHSTGDIVVLSQTQSNTAYHRVVVELLSATVRGGMTSLNEQCVYVIMSALLEQRKSLDPDQLPARLPDYVPPSVKHYLACALRARTSVPSLPPPDLPGPPSKRRRME